MEGATARIMVIVRNMQHVSVNDARGSYDTLAEFLFQFNSPSPTFELAKQNRKRCSGDGSRPGR